MNAAKISQRNILDTYSTSTNNKMNQSSTMLYQRLQKGPHEAIPSAKHLNLVPSLKRSMRT